MSSAVEIQGVTKTFGEVVAVNDLSLTVPTGSVYGFIGPNGSGKTTTLRMIMRILHPDCGALRVLGEDATQSAAASDRIGYLPEERGLYRKMVVGEVLRFYAELKGMRDCEAAIDEWLARVGLADYKKKKVEALSKGMSQKVQFIATVLHRPELIILDEPFSGLDPVNMESIKDAVLDLKRGGATVIFSTHDMDVAEKMCDFIFMIFKGRKVLDGTLEEIKRKYGNDTLRVRMSGNGHGFGTLAGVDRVNDFGRFQELRMTSGADPQAILRQLSGAGRIEHFEIAQPSLHDIFVRIAGPEAQGESRA
ncbi:MAG TPA: ATP-binding cassette domain-containing protein [Phycisphaerae bacterium]|nr:ATP-binding cassette domain-containing protein [Phycisphaerae bacterium]